MTTTATVFFDGKTLVPSSPLDLRPNRSYVVSIREEAPAAVVEENAWDELEALAGTVEAPSDWAKEHDHYLYGVAKRQE